MSFFVSDNNNRKKLDHHWHSQVRNLPVHFAKQFRESDDLENFRPAENSMFFGVDRSVFVFFFKNIPVEDQGKSCPIFSRLVAWTFVSLDSYNEDKNVVWSWQEKPEQTIRFRSNTINDKFEWSQNNQEETEPTYFMYQLEFLNSRNIQSDKLITRHLNNDRLINNTIMLIGNRTLNKIITRRTKLQENLNQISGPVCRVRGH